MNNSGKQENAFEAKLDDKSFRYETLEGGRSQFPPQTGYWYAYIHAIRSQGESESDAVNLTFLEDLPADKYQIKPDGPITVTYTKMIAGYIKAYIAVRGTVILTRPLGTRAVGTFKVELDNEITLMEGSFNVLCPKAEPRP